MKMIIDIPEETNKFIQETSFVENTDTIFSQNKRERKRTMMLFDILDAIRDGTPLPEGHGRLIDADAIPRHLVRDIDEIDKQPTIIEADRGE